MEQQMMKKEPTAACFDFLYFLSCTVSGDIPEDERIKNADMETVYTIASRHLLVSLLCSALERSPAFHQLPATSREPFLSGRHRAIRRAMLYDSETADIMRRLEEQNIWFVPLKGADIQIYYPEYGTRECFDTDILYDRQRQKDVKKLMLAAGFRAESVGKGNTDNYTKAPIFEFELHTSLFGKDAPQLRDLFENIRASLLPCKESGCRLCFSPEDRYFYTVAHSYKHYISSGIGFRTLTDLYVIRKAKEIDFDSPTLQKKLSDAGLTSYEKRITALCEKLLSHKHYPSPDDFTKEEADLIDLIFASGASGTFSQIVKNRLQNGTGADTSAAEQTKKAYVLSRLFPSKNAVKNEYPFFYRHPIFLPALWIFRLFRKLFFRHDTLSVELKTCSDYYKKRDGQKKGEEKKHETQK